MARGIDYHGMADDQLRLAYRAALAVARDTLKRRGPDAWADEDLARRIAQAARETGRERLLFEAAAELDAEEGRGR